jgi:hypothetical protein
MVIVMKTLPLFDPGKEKFEFLALALLGERVDRHRRFHQPGRDG